MIKKGFVCVLLVMAITFSGFSQGIEIEGQAPTIKAKNPNDPAWLGYAPLLIYSFNNYLDEFFKAMIDDIQGNVNGLFPPGLIKSDSLLKGFGTSAVFASHGATMWSYADYKFLSISIGSIFGIKLPTNSIDTFMTGLSDGQMDFNQLLSDTMTFGISPQFFNIHVGIYPRAKFEIMSENLFFGLRIGYFGLPKLSIPGIGTKTHLDFSSFTIGITANYQFVKTYELANGLVKWRGVNFGSGIIFQTTKLDLSIPFDINIPVPSYNGIPGQILGQTNDPLQGLQLKLDPKATFNVGINTITIPIEATTAIKLLIFNIPFGIGFDIGFGSSQLSVGAEAGVSIDGDKNSMLTEDKAGSLSVSINNNKISPEFFNFKIMTGFGFTINDVFVIDTPITFYLPDGFSIGFTMGLRL